MGLEQSTSKYQEATTLNTFSSHIEDKKQAVPTWYLSGNHRISITYAHLHLLCSPLNDHLYSYIRVVDSPVCHAVILGKTTSMFYLTALYLQLKELQCSTV